MPIYPKILKYIILTFSDLLIGTKYCKYLILFSKMENWSRADIDSWQNKKLKKLIYHVYKNVPFYREYMDKNGIKPIDICSKEDLKKLPIIDKDIIRNNFNKFIPDNLNKFKYKIAATGGSTGIPMKYYLDYETQSAMWAKRIHVLKKAGFNIGEKYLNLGSSSIIPIQNEKGFSSIFHKLIRMIPVNGSNMSDKVCKRCIDIIRCNRLKLVYGYSSSIFLLAKYALNNNIKLDINIVMTTSEKLTPIYEEIIKKAFTCKIIDEYGAREAGILSYRCSKLNYHIIETCITTSEKLNEKSELIFTSLSNDTMPFINYKAGDIALISDEICKCGKESYIITDLIGRSSDYIELENGHVLTGVAFAILFSKLNVKGFQIVKSDYLTIELRIEKNDNYNDEDERKIISSFKKFAGENCKIVFNYNYHFLLLPSGKRNYFIN